MSQDIVERLRGRHECAMNAHGYDLKLHYEAADTIESLRARVKELERLHPPKAPRNERAAR